MIKVSFVMITFLISTSASLWAADEKSSDMELLEFLGNFETSNGKSVDPLLFKQDRIGSKKKESSVKQEKEGSRQQKDKSELKERDYEK